MRKEPEHPSIPDRENILYLDPQELIRDNPAADIYNPESYRLMEGRFDWDMFDNVKVARVITYDPEKGEVLKLFVVDGHTRTKYAADHLNVLIPAVDMTSHYLQNPVVSYYRQESDEREALTISEYLRAIIPPTKLHEVIARPRIAAHIVNAWRNIVGEDIAEKYPTSVTLRLLGDRRVPTSTSDMLSRFLKSQESLMLEETPEQRDRLEQAILQINGVINEAGLFPQEVAQAAFELIASESPVIGGKRELEKQVFASLNQLEVERKISAVHQDVSRRELLRDKLAQQILQAVRSRENSVEKRDVLSAVHDSLIDPNFSYDRVVSVIQAESPKDQYDLSVRDVNYGRLSEAYSSSQQRNTLSGSEQALLQNLGRIRYLADRDISGLVSTVQRAHSEIQAANHELSRLTEQRETLVEQGVRADTIDEIIETLRNESLRVISAQTQQTANRLTADLRDLVLKGQARIQNQIHVHATNAAIEQVYGDKPTVGFGRPDIIRHILDQIETHELVPADIAKRIVQLQSLDTDLQERVVNGYMRIGVALQRQKQRSEQPQAIQQDVLATIVEEELPTKEESEPVEKPARRESLSKKTLDILTRIEQNNEDLRNKLIFIRNALSRLDLEPHEVDERNKEIGREIIDVLGIAVLGIPHLSRIGEDYQEAVERKKRELETKVQKDMTQIEKDKDNTKI